MSTLADRLAAVTSKAVIEYPALRCVIVERADHRVLENCFQGASVQDRHPLRSVTKSVLATLLGMAWDDGTLGSLEFPFADAFPEYSTVDTPMYEHGTTTEHVLAMTAGFDWPVRHSFREMRLHDFLASRDWTSFAVNLPIRRERIERFGYCSPASHLLSSFLQRATGMSCEAFAKERLFGPLDIQSWDWDSDPQGVTIGGWGLHLNGEDLAKVGRLYIQRGHWQGGILLSPEWIDLSTRNHTPHYGYHWWTREIHGRHVFFAAGTGGQYLIVMPELAAFVVILSQPDFAHGSDPWPLFEHGILPILCADQVGDSGVRLL